jgi:hypothetical protein
MRLGSEPYCASMGLIEGTPVNIVLSHECGRWLMDGV